MQIKITSFYMLQIIFITYQLDCFKLKSEAIYDRQRDVVNFTAIPSKKLVGDELAYCNTTMNGQMYDLTIMLGDVEFFLPSQKYNNSKQLDVRVPCAAGKNCSYGQVQNIQAATYVMTFTELNINVTSIIGQYDVQVYDHRDCLGGAILTFDIQQNVMSMVYTNKAKECTISGGKYNFSYKLQSSGATIPFSNQAKNYQLTYFNDKLLLDNQVPYPLYPAVFPKCNITANTSPEQFVNDLVTIGPISQSSLPLMPVILQQIRENKIKSMYQYLKQTLTVDQTVNQTVTKIDYNTTISYYITKKFNIKQDNCLVNMTLLLEGNDLLFKANYDPAANQCGDQYMTSLGITYDSIQFYLEVIQNEDFTGFYYNQTFTIPNYTIGFDVNYDIPCKSQADCKYFDQLIALYQEFPNITLIMQQVYMKDDEPQFRSTYVPKVLTRPHYDLIISMRQASICFSYQPSQNTINTLYVIFSDLVLEYQFYTDTSQTKYCQEYTQAQEAQVNDLIQSNINKHSFKAYIGQYRISQVSLIIYYLPQSCETSWAIMGGFFLSIIIIAVVLAVQKGDFTLI